MAMIRALPEEFSNFASSLLLMDKLDKAAIQQAFYESKFILELVSIVSMSREIFKMLVRQR